jgi:hypothetical protein
MPLVYRHEDHTFRVDGDVLEPFINGQCEHRILLSWLFVLVRPSNSKRWLELVIGTLPPDKEMPLYQVSQKLFGIKGAYDVVRYTIRPEEEPALREFFTQVAQLCGRPVEP